MPLLLVLALVAVPLTELALAVQVGQVIGTWPTVGLLLATSILGAWLLRREGRRAWREFRAVLDQGRWPGDEVAQGAMAILGGALLLAPGFLTDGVGLVLLLAPVRRILSRQLRRRLSLSGDASGRAGRRPGVDRSGRVLEVEVVDIEREDGSGTTDGRRPPPRGELPGGDPPAGRI